MKEQQHVMEPNGSVPGIQDRLKAHRILSSSSDLHNIALVHGHSSPPAPEAVEKPAISPTRAYIAVAVLCYINLLNYIERYILAAVLLNIQDYFGINDSTSGFLHAVYICSLILLPPVFGYLGDRYNRKFIMIGGLCVWLVSATSSSFVSKSYFWVLALMRALVGIGGASYITIAPTIIADLFTGAQRSLMISAFYIFIPVGGGLSYIAGASIMTLTGDWHWSLRVTPIMGLVGLVLLIFLCPNPPRGAAETHGEGVTGPSSYLEDLKYLAKNKGFLLASMGLTAVTFLDGAFAFWMPTFLHRARVTRGIQKPCITHTCKNKDSYNYGAVTVVTGILGVCISTALSRHLRGKVSNVDPLICAVALLGAFPCLLIIILVASTSIPVTYFFIFLDETMLVVTWPTVADITMYIVTPTRRATAEAIQTSFTHLLGDVGSPYLIGVISDSLSKYKPASLEWSFHSMKYSLLVCPFVAALGGVFFIMAALHMNKDRTGIERLVEDPSPATVPNLELSALEN